MAAYLSEMKVWFEHLRLFLEVLCPQCNPSLRKSRKTTLREAMFWWFCCFMLVYTLTAMHLARLVQCSYSGTEGFDPTSVTLHHNVPQQQGDAVVNGKASWSLVESPQTTFHAPILSPPHAIFNSTTVILVLSKYNHQAQRKAIRETWASMANNVFFVVAQPLDCRNDQALASQECGSAPNARSQNRLLQQEQAKFNDLLEIPMTEAYNRLPEKLVQAYAWVTYSFPRIQWIVKVDDDMYCRPKQIPLYLRRFNPNEPILLGDFQVYSNVWNGGKWAERDYNELKYPIFPSGSAGHVASYRIASYIVNHSASLHRFQGEDTSLGIWLDNSSLTDRIYINTHRMFQNSGGTSFCGDKDTYIVGHNLTAADMLECHQKFLEETIADEMSNLWIDQPIARTVKNVPRPKEDIHRQYFKNSRRLEQERSRWILLCLTIILFHNRHSGWLQGPCCRHPFIIMGTCLFVGLLLKSALNRRSMLQPLHRGKPKVYVCGWTVDGHSAVHVASLFPNHEYIPLDDEPPSISSPEDLMITSESFAPQCDRVWRSEESFSHWVNSFRGKVLQRNGENQPMQLVTGRDDQVYELGFKEDDKAHMRFRYVQTVLLEYGPSVWSSVFNSSQRPRSRGNKFLIYAQRQCHPHREEAFDRLADINTVDYGGVCRGSMRKPRGIREASDLREDNNSIWKQNKHLFTSYRFCLVMENTFPALDGYLTEKILNAFLAGCIPIYWGPQEVFDIFNKRAFVFYDVKNPEPALNEVRRLESSQPAFESMLNEPILANGTVTIEKYFSFTASYGGGQLQKRLHKFLGLPTGEDDHF